jgi:hypothetical protein
MASNGKQDGMGLMVVAQDSSRSLFVSCVSAANGIYAALAAFVKNHHYDGLGSRARSAIDSIIIELPKSNSVGESVLY